MTRRLCITAAAAFAIFTTQSLQAADFTIGSGETVTITQTLGDNETGTVEKGGTISTTGVNQEGIEAGSGNTIRNDGTISASNSGASGISADGSNTITNSGTISTRGGSAAYAVYVSGGHYGNLELVNSDNTYDTGNGFSARRGL
jgi:hypothetical protein